MPALLIRLRETLARSALRAWGQAALDFIFPAECAACKGFSGDDRVSIFCKTCWDGIQRLDAPGCRQCGRPFLAFAAAPGFPEFLCGECQASPPFFDRAISAAFYGGVMKAAIHQFKFSQKTGLGNMLASVILQAIDGKFDPAVYRIILPVPLHRSRYKQRGYNQAELLARHVADAHHLTLMTENLVRVRQTTAQWKIATRRDRRKNVKDAFQVRVPEQIRGQHLIVLDDIFTTGATVNECAKVLKEAGAASVFVVTLSRAGYGTRVQPSGN